MVHTNTSQQRGQPEEQHSSNPSPSYSATPYERLERILRYQHVDRKHLKIGPYEYVEIVRSKMSKEIYVERAFRSKPDANLTTQSLWFKSGDFSPCFNLGRLPDIEKLLNRIEQGEDHYECLTGLSPAKQHRYRFEHPECFSQVERRIDKPFEYIGVSQRVTSMIRSLATDSRLVRPGLNDLTETLIDSFMDALYLSWQLDVEVKKLVDDQKRKGGGIYHYPFDLGHLTHTAGPLNRAVESILSQLDVIQQAAPELSELQTLRSAAFAIQSASELFLESQQYHYTYYFRALLADQRATEQQEALRDGDVLQLEDGRRVIVVISPKVQDEGYRKTALVEGIVIYPSGLVEEGKVVFREDDSCKVIRSDRPWALDDTKQRQLVTCEGRGATRVELLGKDRDHKPYYVVWSDRHPFYNDSVAWVHEQLSANRFASFPIPKIETLLDGLQLRGFPSSLIVRQPIQWKRTVSAAQSQAKNREAPPAPEGLEHLCKLIQSVDTSVYLHVCGTPFREDGFSSCRMVNGMIVTAESAQKVLQLKENQSENQPSIGLPRIVPETLLRYPVTPILLVTADVSCCERDIKLAREHGWTIVFFNDVAGGAGRYIQELMPLIRSQGEQVQVVKRTQSALQRAIYRITQTSSLMLSDPIERADTPATTTNKWVREFDRFSHEFERRLCEDIAPHVTHSEQLTKQVAHFLRSIHTAFKSIRRALLFTDLELGEWISQPNSIEGLTSVLSVVPKEKFDPYLERISKAVDELRILTRSLYAMNTSEGQARIGVDTVISGRDIVRISQLMEAGRNDIFGPAGSLHGMMYGDMSPERFATFFREGCSLVSYRDIESGTIQGFIINYPKWATLKLKGESAQALASLDSTRVIAISIDVGFKTQEPQLYAKLIRTFLLNQIRDGIEIMHMRVHPRNLKASVPHMATAGFLPTSVADEWVDGQRFVTMFHDVGAYCDDPTKVSALRLNEAVHVAWSLYMEEYPGRDPQQNHSQDFAAQLYKLINARIDAWDQIEAVTTNGGGPKDAVHLICDCLGATALQIKAERRMEVEAILDQLTGLREWPGDALESLLSALTLALNSRAALERDRIILERYLTL